jgi:phosphodiesterase/alkaline phosphatase D-like protein
VSATHYPNDAARRRWLLGVGGAAGVVASPAGGFLGRAKLAFVPAVFDAANGRALVGIWGNRALDVHVRWSRDRANVAAGSKSSAISLTRESDFVGHFSLNRLPSGLIHYAVYDADEALSDVQSFRMPPAPGTREDFALAFSGDMEERYRPFRIFDTIAAQGVDAFLHLGDAAYIDIPKREFSPTIEHYRRKHAAIRADQALQRFGAKTATIAVWDDHEIENDCHGGHPAMATAERAFREYWPVRNRAPGLFRSLSFGDDVELFVLDGRRFRSPQNEPASESKTMLGRDQLQWFQSAYRESKARYRLVGTSVPFHGSSKDAWGNYQNERDTLLSMFRDAYAEHRAKTVLLSADYHFAREWPKNERRGVYEFMAGPLATFLTFEKENGARERHSRGSHFVFGDRPNFGVLRYAASTRELSVSYFDDTGKPLHHRTL